MPVYNDNILPTYASWDMQGASVTSDNKLSGPTGAFATFQFKTDKYNAGNYALVSCEGCTGKWFFYVTYVDNDTSKTFTEAVAIPNSGIELPIILQQAKTDALVFKVYCASTGIIYPVSFQLIEQAIRSVDLEYASGTSKTAPPETGWQSNAPEWQTGRYIWQRTATTFVDGHTEYSSPILIQNINSSAILAIEEQYYLSTSNTEPISGTWSTEQPSWSSQKYIWTRSKITWADGTTTYSDATVAKSLNEANEHAQDAIDAVEDLDEALDADGVFNRLTNNGQRQGLYIENGNYYFNATYIRSGTLEVVDNDNKTVFKADMTSKSVYLAGFTASNKAIYYQRASLEGPGTPYTISGSTYYYTGTYVGTDGISTNNMAGLYIVMTAGHLRMGDRHGDLGGIGYSAYYSSSSDSANVFLMIDSDNILFSGNNIYVTSSNTGSAIDRQECISEVISAATPSGGTIELTFIHGFLVKAK